MCEKREHHYSQTQFVFDWLVQLLTDIWLAGTASHIYLIGWYSYLQIFDWLVQLLTDIWLAGAAGRGDLIIIEASVCLSCSKSSWGSYSTACNIRNMSNVISLNFTCQSNIATILLYLTFVYKYYYILYVTPQISEEYKAVKCPWCIKLAKHELEMRSASSSSSNFFQPSIRIIIFWKYFSSFTLKFWKYLQYTC